MDPFGTHQPQPNIQHKIDRCQKLPANWLGRLMALGLRYQVMSKATMPLDITLGQLKLRCYFADNQSESDLVFMPWRWDQLERQLLLKLLPTDGVFIDIGAHAGLYAAIAATHLNRQGVLVAIEPNPAAYQRLCFNLKATLAERPESPRAELLQQAISGETGEVTLSVSEDNSSAHLLPPNDSSAKQINMPCTPLMDVIESQKLSRVDVIKCDMDGAEDMALMPFLLDAPNHLLPACFIIKDHAGKWQNSLPETLQHRGYLPTHETGKHVIFQQRQPKQWSPSAKKYKGATPVVTLVT